MTTLSKAEEPSRLPVHILSVPRTGYLLVVFAGPYRGANFHWKGVASVPCLPEPDCPVSLHRSGTTWKGFAPVRQWDHVLGVWTPWTMEITEALEEMLRGHDLRGQLWRLSRQRKKKGPGACQGVLEELRDDPELLVPFDIRQVVERRYRCGPITWDVPNPVKPKLKVEVVSSAPPNSLPVFDPYRQAHVALPDPAEAGMTLNEKVQHRTKSSAAAASGNGHTADDA